MADIPEDDKKRLKDLLKAALRQKVVTKKSGDGQTGIVIDTSTQETRDFWAEWDKVKEKMKGGKK